jgi:Tfp pilus assembly protein PilF
MEKCSDAVGARSAIAAGLSAFPNDAGLAELQARLGITDSLWRYMPLTESSPEVATLRRRLAANQRDEDALFSLSQHYSVRGQALADALTQVAPESFRAIQLKATAAEYAGDLATAEQLYRAVLSKNPRLHGIHYSFGHVLTQLGREKEAEEHFRLELDHDPLHYLAWFELGTSALKRGDVAGARKSLTQTVSLRPGFSPANLALAKIMLQTNEAAEAVRCLQQVVGREPAHTSAHFLLYRAYLRIGQKTEAARELAIHQKLLKQRNASDGAGMR